MSESELLARVKQLEDAITVALEHLLLTPFGELDRVNAITRLKKALAKSSPIVPSDPQD